MGSFLLLAVVFTVSALGPGFFILRKLDLEPFERVTASVGVSLVCVYTACFGIYLAGLSPAAHWVVFVVAAALGAACWKDLIRCLRLRKVRSPLAWYVLAAAFSIGLAALVRNFSGGGWYGDWLEHYQRSNFFLDRPALDVRFQGGFALPSRPPLMNVLCAYLMSIAGRSYPAYQTVSCLLNSLVWLPAVMAARFFSKTGRTAPAVVAAFLLLNPMIAQNLSYSWTKLLTAFFVVGAIVIYFEAWRRGDRARFAIAAALLAGGIVTHYSAAPYAIFIGAHYALVILPRRKARGREAAILLLAAAAAMGPWIAWALDRYGAGTFTATSTYADAAGRGAAGNVSKIGRNIFNSIVPHLVRGVENEALSRGPTWGGVRDAAFKVYQSNLIFAFGSLGILLIAASLLPRGRRAARGHDPPGRSFWIAFLAFTIVVGIAVHGNEDRVGLAHICLQPLVVLGLAFLAARSRAWPAILRFAAAAGLLADAVAGIALHFWFQHITFGGFAEGQDLLGLTRSDLLVGSVYANWTLKEKTGLVYLGDVFSQQAPLVAVLLAGFGAWLLFNVARHGSERTEASRSKA